MRQARGHRIKVCQESTLRLDWKLPYDDGLIRPGFRALMNPDANQEEDL